MTSVAWPRKDTPATVAGSFSAQTVAMFPWAANPTR